MLEGQVGDTLALATLAAQWPEMFAGGWITQDHLAKYGRHFEDPGRGNLSEANRSGFARARRRLLSEFPELRLESHATIAEGRAAFRFAEPPPPDCRAWLASQARSFLERDLWEPYLMPADPWDVLVAIQEGAARALALKGRWEEAIALVDQAADAFPTREDLARWTPEYAGYLSSFRGGVNTPAVGDDKPAAEELLADACSQACSRYDRRYLVRYLRWVRLDLSLEAGKPAKYAAAGAGAAALIRSPLPHRGPRDRLLDARLRIARVHCAYHDRITRLMEELDDKVIKECNKDLDEAEHLIGDTSHVDRGRTQVLRALLILCEARASASMEEARPRFERAELLLREAFSIAQVAGDAQLLSASLQYHAACIFQLAAAANRHMSAHGGFFPADLIRRAETLASRRADGRPVADVLVRSIASRALFETMRHRLQPLRGGVSYLEPTDFAGAMPDLDRLLRLDSRQLAWFSSPTPPNVDSTSTGVESVDARRGRRADARRPRSGRTPHK